MITYIFSLNYVACFKSLNPLKLKFIYTEHKKIWVGTYSCIILQLLKYANFDYENSISKCNFADKIGKFVFFQSQEE